MGCGRVECGGGGFAEWDDCHIFASRKRTGSRVFCEVFDMLDDGFDEGRLAGSVGFLGKVNVFY